MKTFKLICTFAAVAMLSLFARAERADRDKPVNLEADRVAVDDRQHMQIFEGNVKLSQGTLTISTAHMIVRQDAEGFQKGEARGGVDGLSRFRQKREGRNDFIEGEAERIEHDSRSEKTEFFGRAKVKSGLDEVRGAYISFDAKSENYLVTNAGSKDRVSATIQPKEKPKGDTASDKP